MFKKKPILIKENILLGLDSVNRDDAIKKAGEMLIASGYVKEDYIKAMYEREEIVSTYIGNGIAIPHGVGKSRGLIKSSGLVILQYPNGIDYNGNKCYLVIGISGKDNDHIRILANIAEQFSDIEQAEKLWKTNDKELLYSLLTKEDEK
jgi:PTS system mannitol-specific IIC component